ncbi:hypothetical protein DSL72_002627 [Monilinia vaccinii-corymbosi]|uniref:Uncharacterized protein n=1 Tax=Monilinia vaccinii-corymbosi TaxID=61207 RepID=A0A8A3PD03_9HELO|nr:hypothetical protein DSL72_002627 [Monilinia vaccinii-corymbosi]
MAALDYHLGQINQGVPTPDRESSLFAATPNVDNADIVHSNALVVDREGYTNGCGYCNNWQFTDGHSIHHCPGLRDNQLTLANVKHYLLRKRDDMPPMRFDRDLQELKDLVKGLRPWTRETAQRILIDGEDQANILSVYSRIPGTPQRHFDPFWSQGTRQMHPDDVTDTPRSIPELDAAPQPPAQSFQSPVFELERLQSELDRERKLRDDAMSRHERDLARERKSRQDEASRHARELALAKEHLRKCQDEIAALKASAKVGGKRKRDTMRDAADEAPKSKRFKKGDEFDLCEICEEPHPPGHCDLEL